MRRDYQEDSLHHGHCETVHCNLSPGVYFAFGYFQYTYENSLRGTGSGGGNSVSNTSGNGTQKIFKDLPNQ